MIRPMINGPGGTMPQSPFRTDPGIRQAPGARPSINGPGGMMPQNPFGQDPGIRQAPRVRPAINGPGGIQSPWAIGGGGGGQGQINGPGGIQSPWGIGGGGGGQAQINGPGGIQNPNPGLPRPFPSTPFPGMTGGQIGPQQQSQQPYQPASGQQSGLQQRFGGSTGTTNPYMPQFQQPMPQPQQMPQNPYNPYQNNWDWNQSGQFPGNRFPAY